MKTTRQERQERAIAAAEADRMLAEEDREIEAEIAQILAELALGHLYVIEFTSGVVKVGRATAPAERIAAHARIAELHGGAIRRSWVSRELVCYRGAERDLIKLCSQRGKPVSGREYFDIGYQAAYAFATLVEINRYPVADLSAEDLEFLRGKAVAA